MYTKKIANSRKFKPKLNLRFGKVGLHFILMSIFSINIKIIRSAVLRLTHKFPLGYRKSFRRIHITI